MIDTLDEKSYLKDPEFVFQIMHMRFDYGESLDSLDPLRDDEIDPSDIDGEFRRHSRLTKLYGFLLAQAELRYEQASAQLEKQYAILDGKTRDFFLTMKISSTEKGVEAHIKQDEVYQVARERVHEAKHQRDLCRSMVKALEAKANALMHEGANQRKLIENLTSRG